MAVMCQHLTGGVRGGQCDNGGCVVDARGVAGRDRESVDLGVQHLEPREGLDSRLAPRMLVLGERDRSPVGLRDLDRHDLVDEGAGVDGLDGALVAAQRPFVLRLTGDPVLHRTVVGDGDGHVEGGSILGGGMGEREPGVLVVLG
jgi:hypothetical protein